MADASAEYRVTPSINTGPLRLRLIGDTLSVERAKRGTSDTIRLADITSVRLTFIQGIGRCELHTARDKLVITSRSWRGIGDFVEQILEYRAFVVALHERIAAVAPRVRYMGGTSFGFALGVFAVVVSVGAAVFAMIVSDANVWFELGGPLLVGASVGVPLMLAGRAKPYRPDALPAKHLPS